MTAEKRPGWDWDVTYEDDEGIDVMRVFGAMTPEEVIADARAAFPFHEGGLAILKVERLS